MSDDNGTRVAVVTGGSRGIGRAIVEALAGEGWRVFLCGRRRESVDAAVAELGARFGDRVAGRAVDVRDQQEVEAFVAWVLERAGRIDCLVNNAGLGRFGPVDELTGEEWREVLRTNLDGAFYCLRAVAPAMKRQGSGYVLNIASLAAKNPFAGGAAYNASKFGLLGFSEAAMLDLRHDGIRISCILPGSVETEFRAGRGDSSWMLAPEDVARTVLGLLAYPERALPSRVELRPTRPPKR
jgi:NAD(P)-dependent dehydrogenase (short-subunit alcohol dehydrogenase family)